MTLTPLSATRVSFFMGNFTGPLGRHLISTDAYVQK